MEERKIALDRDEYTELVLTNERYEILCRYLDGAKEYSISKEVLSYITNGAVKPEKETPDEP